VTRTSEPDPVVLIVAALYARADDLERAERALIARWGEIGFEGLAHPFDATDYYDAEMGAGLQRRILAFEQPVAPDALEALAAAKLTTNAIEADLAVADAGGGPLRRRVNLDVGYLDHGKVVLASMKGAGQKIYLGRGVWADLVARYGGGRYRPFEWTFPDFADGRYDDELGEIRRRYLERLREDF